jgi:hypothetical protein
VNHAEFIALTAKFGAAYRACRDAREALDESAHPDVIATALAAEEASWRAFEILYDRTYGAVS